jgi:hypothetical protein
MLLEDGRIGGSSGECRFRAFGVETPIPQWAAACIALLVCAVAIYVYGKVVVPLLGRNAWVELITTGADSKILTDPSIQRSVP